MVDGIEYPTRGLPGVVNPTINLKEEYFSCDKVCMVEATQEISCFQMGCCIRSNDRQIHNLGNKISDYMNKTRGDYCMWSKFGRSTV